MEAWKRIFFRFMRRRSSQSTGPEAVPSSVKQIQDWRLEKDIVFNSGFSYSGKMSNVWVSVYDVGDRLTVHHQLHISDCKSKRSNRGSAHIFPGVLQLKVCQLQSSVSEDQGPTGRQITTRLWPLHLRLYVTRCLATDGSIISLVDKEDFRGLDRNLDYLKLCLGTVRSDSVFRRAFVLALVLFGDVKEHQHSIFNNRLRRQASANFCPIDFRSWVASHVAFR